MGKRYSLILLLITVSIGSALAQEPKNPSDFFESEIIKIEYTKFGSFVFSINQVSYRLGSRLPSDVSDRLKSLDASAILYKAYVSENAWAYGCVASGIAAFLSAGICAGYYVVRSLMAILSFDPKPIESDLKINVAIISLSITGVSLALSGSLLRDSAYKRLFAAVNSYNSAKMRQYDASFLE